MLWIDAAAIPKDAPNPEQAHRFLDFMMRAQGRGRLEHADRLRQRQRPGHGLLDKSITGNPWIYPPADDARQALHHHRRQRRADPRAHAAVDGDQDRPLSWPGERAHRQDRRRRQALRRRPGRCRRRSRDRARRAVRAAGRLGLRQDHPAAHAGGLRDARCGPHPDRRRRT